MSRKLTNTQQGFVKISVPYVFQNLTKHKESMGKMPLSASSNAYFTLKRFLTNTFAQLTYVKISCIEFHPDGSRNRESRSRSLFLPLRDV